MDHRCALTSVVLVLRFSFREKIACVLSFFFPQRMSKMFSKLTILLFSIMSCCGGSEIQLTIAAAGTRCFGEELAVHDLLVVKASSIQDPSMLFSLIIKAALTEAAGNSAAASGTGTVVYKEERKSQVSHAFTSTTSGPHWVCVTNVDSYRDLAIMLSLKSGVAAKDYSQIAKKDHLEPTQVTIRRIEDLLHEYRSNLFYQRRREERMHQTLDATADRAFLLALFNSVIIVGVGIFQVFFFRRFFKSKKII